MRDNTKPEEYYQKIYNQDTDLLDFYNKQLQEVALEKGWNFQTIPFCYSGIAIQHYLRFYTGYTIGKNYDDLLPDAQKYVENGLKGCDGRIYGDFENIIYFVILFNLSEYKQEIKNFIETYQEVYKDNYMEHLYKFLDSSYKITTDRQFWLKDNKPMLETITLSETDKTAAVQRLKKYVDKEWFKTLKEGPITNTSKRYRGYWCIEAAALVRALDLDDTELKNSKYYPYDLAHFLDE